MKKATRERMLDKLGSLENTRFCQWDYYGPSDETYGRESGKEEVTQSQAIWLRNLLYCEGIFSGPKLRNGSWMKHHES